MDIRAYNRASIEQFRGQAELNDGMDRHQLILLTTMGARSGQPHTTPLTIHRDVNRLLVVAAAVGAPQNPAWYVNLRVNSKVTVESTEETYEARAYPLEGAEYDRTWRSLKDANTYLAEFESAVDRTIPVVALVRVGSSELENRPATERKAPSAAQANALSDDPQRDPRAGRTQ